MTEMTLEQLAQRLGGTLQGDGNVVVRGVSTLEAAQGDQVSFLANNKYERQVESSRAAAVIVSRKYAGQGKRLIRCDDPYYAYREALVVFHGWRRPHFAGVDPRANVEEGVALGSNVNVAAFVTVAAGSEVGDGATLYPGVYVGPGCRIGPGCTLYPNVTLYDGTVLGANVTIHAGSSIGHDGFGYATHKGADGVVRHEKIPQTGHVEIEDDVEIGACCTIDRAAMGATIIGAGSKFSNLVAIGHGTKMGKHCLLVAQAGLAGSVHVGNYCVFAGQSGVVGHVKIGDGVRIGAQSGVTNDVDAGQEVLGSPAVPLASAKRAILSVSRLPEMRDALRKLASEWQAVKERFGLDDEGNIGQGGPG